MLAEPQNVKLIDECNKMQKLSSNQLPDLIKSFELKVNQQKDVIQVNSGRPAPKMKLRNAQEVLEIARLKVLVSEMREKTMKLEAQLELATGRCDNEIKNSCNAGQDNRNEEKKTVFSSEDAQETSQCETKKVLVKQEMKLEKDRLKLHARIESLQRDVSQMLLELSTRADLHEELVAAKSRIKALQEEIKDDACLTKEQLLVLKQQFGELEEMKIASERKQREFQRASEISRALEAEIADLTKGNQVLLKQKEKLGQKLSSELKKAEKITPVTKDDLLASEAEVSELRLYNVKLQKEVESLQMSRFNEVEELVYLRWVNACLRHDLDIYRSSRRNSDKTCSQTDNCIPAAHGKDEPMLRTNSGRSSTSYNTTHEYPASDHESKSVSEQQECSLMSSPNKRTSSPASTKYGQMRINTSPLVIPHSHVSISHSSPLASPLGHVDAHHSSPLGTPDGSLNGSPQNSLHGGAKMKSRMLHLTQTQCSVSPYLSQSPDIHRQYSPGKTAVQKDPQMIAELQSMLAFNNPRSKKLDATSSTTNGTQNSLRRTRESFMRSASTFSASSEGSIKQTQRSPQKQNTRTFIRSSSNLSADSDVSFDNQSMKSITSLRRHSASSGMSMLDEYLCSTDTRSLNRPTSRLSAVLPHDRRYSDLESVPFPSMGKVTEPFKREDSTNVKAPSFESHLDASDRVVAAFQRLSNSTLSKYTHPTFKDLSRQNSHDDRAARKVEGHNEHELHVSTKSSTQSDFICDLAQAIQVAHYNSIEQVAAFVNWFDRQGDVEKQDFFKFPDCPRHKVEAMRRAVYEYEELQEFETELNSYKGELEGPANLALQDMKNLLEKVEKHIKGFKQARELARAQFSELHIPTYWMLDSGMIAKIKQAALKLAQRCIKRVTEVLEAQAELGLMSRDHLLLEAARFILQVHNFAGGFDEKTAKAFKILQSQANLQEKTLRHVSLQ